MSPSSNNMMKHNAKQHNKMQYKETEAQLRKIAQIILEEFGSSESVWIDGFANYLLYGHTDSDDDNTYCPEEEPLYSEYKKGARAAMDLKASLQCKPKRIPKNS
jgi:hypothetical protein